MDGQTPERNYHMTSETSPSEKNFPYQDGLIMKGDCCDVAPEQQLQTLIQSVHLSHLGIESCLCRAWECLYWPHMDQHIQHFMQKAQFADLKKRNNRKNPWLLMPYRIKRGLR